MMIMTMILPLAKHTPFDH